MPARTCLFAICIAMLTGCRSGLPVLNLLPLGRPLVVSAVAEDPTAFLAAAPRGILESLPNETTFHGALSAALERPVVTELCLPFQAQICLGTGFHQLAILNASQLARIGGPSKFPIVAVGVDEQGRNARSALLVAPASSNLQNPTDLRGKIVAFGPVQDPRTHLAAVDYLQASGVSVNELSLELLPIAGSLKHLPNDRAVLQSVQNGSSAAGFVDEATFESLPESAASGELSRGGLKVLARTPPVPLVLIVRSPNLPEADVEAVREALVTARDRRPSLAAALNVSGYADPDPAVIALCSGLSPAGEAQPSTSTHDSSVAH